MYFSTEDAVEIFYAVESSDNVGLSELLGPDGESLTDGTFTPNTVQLADMRAALEAKLAAVRSGFYGRDRVTRQWARHLSDILDEMTA